MVTGRSSGASGASDPPPGASTRTDANAGRYIETGSSSRSAPDS